MVNRVNIYSAQCTLTNNFIHGFNLEKHIRYLYLILGRISFRDTDVALKFTQKAIAATVINLKLPNQSGVIDPILSCYTDAAVFIFRWKLFDDYWF